MTLLLLLSSIIVGMIAHVLTPPRYAGLVASLIGVVFIGVGVYLVFVRN